MPDKTALRVFFVGHMYYCTPSHILCESIYCKDPKTLIRLHMLAYGDLELCVSDVSWVSPYVYFKFLFYFIYLFYYFFLEGGGDWRRMVYGRFKKYFTYIEPIVHQR